MEAIIIIVVLAVFILPVAAMISFFKTQKMMRESLFDIRSSLSDISVKLAQLGTTVNNLKERKAPKNPLLPAEVEERDEAMEETTFIIKTAQKTPEPAVKHASLPSTAFTLPPAAETEKSTSSEPEPVHTEYQSQNGQGVDGEMVDDLVFTSNKPTPPQFVEDIRIVLGKLWSWIIVGEEHRRPDISMEYAVASTWLLRLGIGALIGCVAFFLRWSMDRGILGPEGRVAIAVAAGIGLLVTGLRMIGKRYHLLSQGFIGGGVAFLYFATYATGPMYHLLPLPAVFGCMTLVTITAGVLSIATRSQLTAILGIIGGFCTPLLLSTGEPAFPVLYSYMLLLGCGVLGIAHKKQWRLLNYLAFAFTWILFFGSLDQYNHTQDFTVAIVFLSLLFILHSFIVYYYNLVRKKPSTLLEVIHLLVNGALYAGTSYALILEAYGRPWPAVTSIALALFYIAHIYLFLRRRLHDRNLLVVLIGFAGFFTAWAVPLITEKETLTICWSFLGFFFLWVGLRLDSRLLVYMSLLLYFIVAGRLVVWDLPRNFGVLDWTGRPAGEYWRGFVERIWIFGLVIASMFAATLLFRRRQRLTASLSVAKENRLSLPLPSGTFGSIAFIAGVIFLFIVVYCEFAAMFSSMIPIQTPVLTVIWVGLGAYMIYQSMRTDSTLLFTSTGIIAIVILGKLFFFDFASWDYRLDEWVYRMNLMDTFMRLIDYAAVLFMLVLFFRMLKTRVTHHRHELLNFLPVVLLFIYASLETNTFFYYKIPLFQTGALSVVWSLFAIIFLVLGIVRTSRVWRYCGLALFVVVVLKVFAFDLAEMETIYRVIAFMVVGVLLIAGSYAYITASRQFIQKEREEQ